MVGEKREGWKKGERDGRGGAGGAGAARDGH